MSPLKENYNNFAADFARTIITQDFAAAHQFLAPWLQLEMSTSDLQAKFEKELWSMNEVWEIDELIYPVDFSIDSNPSSLASLKAERDWSDSRNFSLQLSDENFRQWMVIEFLPDENDPRTEMDGWFDFWMAVVEIENNLKIGYFEFLDVD